MNAGKFYKDTFVIYIYNVHALLHLHEDAEHLNCSLNQVGVLNLKNYMQQLKRMIRNGRLSEKRSSKLEMTRKIYFSTLVSSMVKNLFC